jgi:hypothetical protein
MLYILDGHARLTGTFKIGTYPEQQPTVLVLADGTMVVRGGYHDLYMVDGRGRYLGGLSLDEEIYEGPHRLGPNSFVVQTESRVLILHPPQP